ncbi:probable G-protein coupled receptor 83 [Limulus polyphemus]|uniref:Probable G-protein coupled receptor 83 n=1 Tax=Limulus polyphemus TaxID=6850 RepID=A0ABM1T6U8_LIMPO|nr:probable G-protein coupled receptor 83 [Limulus polyphemus]
MDPSNYVNATNISNVIQELEALGPDLQVFLIILYSLTAVLALGGNLTVILVLIFGKKSSRDLRVFLINLAASDITMATFSIPFTYTDFMLGRWIFEPFFCPIVMFMQHCSVIVSVYTLTIIGLDRYYAIMYPLGFQWTKSRGLVIIAVIWTVASGISSVQLVHGRAEVFYIQEQMFYDCNEVMDEFDSKVYTIVVFVVTFLLPLLVLTYTYATIGLKMWKHSVPGNAHDVRDHQQLQSKHKAIKMLAVVVLLFAVCWLPIHIFSMLIYFKEDFTIVQNEEEYFAFVAAFFCCHWLSMANSFVNPLVYCFMSENFRADLKQLRFFCYSRRTKKATRLNFPLTCSRHSSSFRTTTDVIASTNQCKTNDPPPQIGMKSFSNPLLPK